MVDNLYTDNDAWLDRWLSLMGPPVPKMRILELGCGSGCDTKFLTDKGYPVTATDISEKALEACKKLAPGAEHRYVDLREPLPFADNSF